MSWDDVHARTAIINTVLQRAKFDPVAAVILDDPEVDRLFGGRDGVLAALRYRWNIHLAARIDQAIEFGYPQQLAWTQLAAEQPELRAILDAYSSAERVA